MELDGGCRIKRCSDDAALLLGVLPATAIGSLLQAFLPSVAPSRQTTELLAAPGQRGGSKRSVGPLAVVEAVHPDGRPLSLSIQVAESIDRPGRYIMRLTCPRGSSSTSLVDSAIAVVEAAGGPDTWLASASAALAGQAVGGHTPSAVPAAAASVPPPRCPFHRAVASSGAGSFLTRTMGLVSSRSATPPPAAAAASQPPSDSVCPFNTDTEAVLASLSFPSDSHFAATGVAVAEAAAVLATSDLAAEQQAKHSGGDNSPQQRSRLGSARLAAAYLRPTASSAKRQQPLQRAESLAHAGSAPAADASHAGSSDAVELGAEGAEQQLGGVGSTSGEGSLAGRLARDSTTLSREEGGSKEVRRRLPSTMLAALPPPATCSSADVM